MELSLAVSEVPMDEASAFRPSPCGPSSTTPGRGRVRTPWVRRGCGPAGIRMAGLLVAVVIGVAVGCRAEVPGTPSSGTQAAAAGAPSDRAPASPDLVGSTYALGGFTWQEVGVGTFDRVESLALFPIDQGLLVVGTSRTAQPRLWLSTDGRRFQPLDASAFASDDPARHEVVVDGLARGPAGYIAVGTLYSQWSGSVYKTSSPCVWRSQDGSHWSRLEALGLPATGLTSIAAVGAGYVVAARPTQTDASTNPFQAYQAYFSADGTSWQATPVVATDVVGHQGHVVATTTDQAVAVTDDGTVWTTVHPAPQIVAVEAAPEGFVGIAYDQATDRQSVVRSADGRTWTTAVERSANLGGGMAYAMGRWLMVGPAPNDPGSAALLTSADAVTWQSSPIPAEVVGDARFGGDRLGGPFYPFGDGFFATTQHELPGGNVTEYGPLQVHLWWVRASLAGDIPGSTVPPEPTPPPTPSGGIGEQQAIAIASARYPNTMTEPYAKLVPIGGFDPKQTLVPPDSLVWAVMVQVQKPGCSGKAPGPSPCELPYSVLAVIVDYFSGDIIEVMDSSP